MGYNYIYDSKSAMKYGQKLFMDENNNYLWFKRNETQ